MKYDILLASASPRRRELIAHLRRDVIAVSTDADETPPEGVRAEDIPLVLAQRKAEAASELPEAKERLIIAADTVVILDGMIFGKPSDRDDARRMLSMLSGKTHTVVTGVYALSPDGKRVGFAETTYVRFFPLTDEQIGRYTDTGEPMDKAGAYGIQGDGCMLVEGISGDYFNVVGLPVARLGRELENAGI